MIILKYLHCSDDKLKMNRKLRQIIFNHHFFSFLHFFLPVVTLKMVSEAGECSHRQVYKDRALQEKEHFNERAQAACSGYPVLRRIASSCVRGTASKQSATLHRQSVGLKEHFKNTRSSRGSGTVEDAVFKRDCRSSEHGV